MHLFNYGYSTVNVLSAMGGVVYYSASGVSIKTKQKIAFKH